MILSLEYKGSVPVMVDGAVVASHSGDLVHRGSVPDDAFEHLCAHGDFEVYDKMDLSATEDKE